MDSNLPCSSVYGILQARTREWVAINFSRDSSWPRDWTWVSCNEGRFFTIWVNPENDFTLSFSVWMSFLFFSPCLLALDRPFNMILHGSGKRRHLCCLHCLRGKTFNLSSGVIFAVSFQKYSLSIWGSSLLIPSFLNFVKSCDYFLSFINMMYFLNWFSDVKLTFLG